jgi:hypothetical protein
MGEIVSLKQARKTRARNAKETQAAANRAAFGRTKAQKAADVTEQARKDALLDGARLTDS